MASQGLQICPYCKEEVPGLLLYHTCNSSSSSYSSSSSNEKEIKSVDSIPPSELVTIFDSTSEELGRLIENLPASKLFILGAGLASQAVFTSKEFVVLTKAQHPDDHNTVLAMTKDIDSFEAAQKAFSRLACFMIAFESSEKKTT